MFLKCKSNKEYIIKNHMDRRIKPTKYMNRTIANRFGSCPLSPTSGQS